MKNLILVLLLLLVCIPIDAISEDPPFDINFQWGMDDTTNVTGYYIYRSDEYLTCQDGFPIEGADHMYGSIPGIDYYGIKFYFGTAVGRWLDSNTGEWVEEESDISNRIVLNHCGQYICAPLDIEVSLNGTMATLSWPGFSAFDKYMVRFHEEGSSDFRYLEANTNFASMVMPYGSWVIEVYPIDSRDEVIYNSSIYNLERVEVMQEIPPQPPPYAVDGRGAGPVKTLMMAFDPPAFNISHNVVNVYSTSALALAGGDGDIIANAIVDRGLNFCQDISFQTVYDAVKKYYKYFPEIIFFTVYSVTYEGVESDAYFGWYMPGNIVGTDNYEGAYTTSKLPFSQAAVNADDLAASKLWYGKVVVHSSQDYCNDPSLKNKLPLSISQRFDANGNGKGDSADLTDVKIGMGSTGDGK